MRVALRILSHKIVASRSFQDGDRESEADFLGRNLHRQAYEGLQERIGIRLLASCTPACRNFDPAATRPSASRFHLAKPAPSPHRVAAHL